MAQIRLYSDIIRGFIEYTGNTVMMTNAAFADAQCAIAPGPPSGTITVLTAWRTNGSAAFLRGLAGSTVVKAYLAWMSTPVPDYNGSSTNQNIAVTFKTPLGSNSITGNASWSQNLPIPGQQFNIRIADVTNLVQAAGIGQYSVEGIPTGANYSGWTLAVVWKKDTLPPRFISIDSYDDLVSSTSQLTVSGFITPPTGVVNGRSAMVVGSAENYTISGPTKFGPSVAGLTTLTGPNNPPTNFFQMQVNDSNSESLTVGQLDTAGTFGNANAPLNAAGRSASNRWHWDQTNVSINSGLTNSQTQGVFQFGPVNNGYVVHMLSLQIDAQSPTFDNTKTVDKTYALPGDTLTYTVVLQNTGTFGTNNITFVDTIPNNTTFVSNTFSIDGTTQAGNPQSGINIGTMGVGATRTISFKVLANTTITTLATIPNLAYIGYTYSPLATLTFSGNSQSNTTMTTITFATISSTKLVDKSYVATRNVLNYTITLNKTGDATANNVIFIDTIPSGTSFVVNSLKLDGVTQTGASPAPPSGFNLGSLVTVGIYTLTFQVNVNTIPSPNVASNSAYINYKFTNNPSTPNDMTRSITTNIVNTTINSAVLSNINKSVDRNYITCGEIITYTITIPNSGNVTAANVVFIDTIPNGASLVSNSVTVNGITIPGANPQTGVNIGTIPAGSSSVVKFSVKINC